MDPNPNPLQNEDKETPAGTAKGPDPLVYGCLVLIIALVVLGGAFALGAWSVLQGHPTPGQP